MRKRARSAASWMRKRARSAASWARRATRNAWRFTKKAAHSASRLGRGLLKRGIRGLRSAARTGFRFGKSALGGLAKAARAAGKFAAATGRLARGAAGALGRAASGLAEAGKLAASGKLGSAWSKIKQTAQNAGASAVAIGQAWLKQTAAAGAAALDGLANFATVGVWGEVKDAVKARLEKLVKGVLGSQLMRWAAKNVPKLVEKVASVLGEGRVASALQAARTVLAASEKIELVLKAVQNPGEYLRRGRDWALDRLSDLVMRVLDPPVRRVAGALMGAVISLIKPVVSVPLTGLVTAAVSAASLGLGAATAPAIWLLINKLLDFAIGKVEGALANLALRNEAIRTFIRSKLLRPLLAPLYGRLQAMAGAIKR